jgi:hypothetical protein
MERDANSLIYALLSQLNTQIYTGNTLMHTFHPYYLLNDQRFQLYLQHFRGIHTQNTYTLNYGLYIGRRGLEHITIKFGKVIICFLKTYKTPSSIFS